MILWAAGLRVTAAWTIATETDSALKQGNYVQGTVLLVLRKRTETEPVFLDEITHEVEAEVRRQLDSMLALEDDSDPNFGDADYQLAAYAAALRVLTARPIEEIDPAREMLRERPRGEVGPVEQLIRSAVKIACDHLVPHGIERDLWKRPGPLRAPLPQGPGGGEPRRVSQRGLPGAGPRLRRGRLHRSAGQHQGQRDPAQERQRVRPEQALRRRLRAASLLRQVLFAVPQTVKAEETRAGLDWLKTELPDYWGSRERSSACWTTWPRLRFVGSMPQWAKDAAAAGLLAGAVRNDHV